MSNPTDTVQQFMAAVAVLDFDSASTFLAPAIRYTNMPLGSDAGTVVGPSGVRSVLEPFFSPTITNEWVIRSTAVAGNPVFVERLDRHQLPGGWAELPVVGVFEVEHGLIVAWRDYFDWNTIVNEYRRAGSTVLG